MSKLLVVKNLVKEFNYKTGWFSTLSKRPINDVSFSVNEGEIVGLIGPNGAGKTTLIHMLLGILKPTAGSINYFGDELFSNKSKILDKISFSSSCYKLAKSLTIEENLRFFSQVYGIPSHLIEDKISNLLLKFGLYDFRHKNIGDLSAGQSNKAMILKAFLPESKIIFFDEPTSFLDSRSASLIRKFILEQREKTNCSIFITSHNSQDVFGICDRVMVLNEGKIIKDDSRENINKLELDFLV